MDAEKETADNAKIGSGKAGPGRPKGIPNKSTQAVKNAILGAAEELGGQERLVAWVKEDPKNEASFWTSIYPKLIPKELTGPEGGELFPREVRVIGVKPD